MKVTVKYFAGLRERFGVSHEEIAIAEQSPTVSDLWRALQQVHPELGRMKQFVRVAVNRDFADDDTLVASADEIALIPPVSGGSGSDEADSDDEPDELEDGSGAFRITREVLDTERVRTHVTRSKAGAVVLFEGVVRDHTADHDVSYLEYETYLAMTLDKLVQTGEEVVDKWAQCQVAIHHRYGRLEIGEKAVVIAVSSPHRAAAFEACQYAIDRLKEIVPIWKKEVGPNGAEWIGMGP